MGVVDQEGHSNRFVESFVGSVEQGYRFLIVVCFRSDLLGCILVVGVEMECDLVELERKDIIIFFY